SSNVTVIDGTTNTVTSTVTAGVGPRAVAVNLATNQIYVANQSRLFVTVIDGATNTASNVPTPGGAPTSVAVNPVTNTIYAVNTGGFSVSVFAEEQVQA